MVKTKKIYRIELREGERMIKIIRHHWLSFLKPLFFSVLVWSISVFILLQNAYGSQFSLRKIADFEDKTVVAFWMILIIGLAYFLASLRIFKSNSLIITNMRAIHNKVRGSFSKTVSDIVFEEGFDISYQVEGFWPTIFNFGDLTIKTERVKIVFKKAPNPQRVKDLIGEVGRQI